MLRRNSLSLKVLLAYVAGVVLSISLLMITVLVVLESDMLVRIDLEDRAASLAEVVAFDADGRPVGLDASEDDLAWLYDSLHRETAYRVLDDAGNVALMSSGSDGFWPDGPDDPRRARGHFDFERDGVAIHGATAAVTHRGRSWYLQFAVSTRFMHLIYRIALPLFSAGVTLFSLVLALAFGLCAFVTLRYTLKPLRDVSESAAAVSPRSIHARLRTEQVPSEIAPLVDGFNRVLERLDRGYRVQQEFLGTAAHELKTPLALIRAQIELLPDGGPDRAALLSDVEYMTRQVQQLLLLAEASEATNYAFTVVRVDATARDAATYLQRRAEAAGVVVTVTAEDDAITWTADRGALFTLLKNLIENAIQHAPAGTSVDVDIARDALTVRDRGPGVPAADLPLMFERYWRAAHRRDHGAGLGLAICQEIALAHGWGLTAERVDPGLRLRLSQGGPAAIGRAAESDLPAGIVHLKDSLR